MMKLRLGSLGGRRIEFFLDLNRDHYQTTLYCTYLIERKFFWTQFPVFLFLSEAFLVQFGLAADPVYTLDSTQQS